MGGRGGGGVGGGVYFPYILFNEIQTHGCSNNLLLVMRFTSKAIDQRF